MKNMDILERMPWLAKDAVFQRLASIAEVAALSKEDREKYDESLRKYRHHQCHGGAISRGQGERFG